MRQTPTPLRLLWCGNTGKVTVSQFSESAHSSFEGYPTDWTQFNLKFYRSDLLAVSAIQADLAAPCLTMLDISKLEAPAVRCSGSV